MAPHPLARTLPRKHRYQSEELQNQFPLGIVDYGEFNSDIFTESDLRAMKTADEIYSVISLTRIIRRIVEDGLPYVWVEGEISNYNLHKSGHRYFTLKDQEAQIQCVMWRTRQVPGFDLEDGLQVRIYGKVTVWERGGRYQLDIKSVLPAGLGALQSAFETLKRKLSAEGLFDQARKRSLPEYPNRIGIVTSPTGAVIHDLVWGFNQRYPPTEIYLIPVKVQGDGAAQEISTAIETFNRFGLVDIIVVGRGGGSLEDLWAFNEEVVVRAVAGSKIPTVSAVGHEVDLTLCDLAADLRAPTPTAATVLIVPDREDLKKSLQEKNRRLYSSLERSVVLWRERVKGISASYGFRIVSNQVAEERLRLDDMNRQFERILKRKVEERKQHLEAFHYRLNALSPQQVLERGYCVARQEDGSVVRDAGVISAGDLLELHFKKGSATTSVKEVHLSERG